jgi:hypothetical protein
MKIGIFGDSFAARPGHAHLPEDKTFWSDTIGEVHDVENFGKAGTNLYWSYNLLKDNYHKFDTIIFVATGFGRYYIPNADHHTVKHAFNIAQIKYLLTLGKPNEDESYSDHDLTILKTLRDYKLYVEDDIQSALFHELLLSEIKRMVPNIILIPSWKGCVDPLKEVRGIDLGYNSLIDISTLDIDYCKISFNDVLLDRRYAHISPANNLILGKDLLRYIESDRKKSYSIDLSLYKNPHPIPKETCIKDYFILK